MSLWGLPPIEISMASTYFEKLKDPRWQKKRLEVLDKAGFCCEVCGDDSQTMHVHHKQYFKGREPWEYEATQLSALCESCHENHHHDEDPLLVAASYVPLDGPFCRQTIASLIAGYCGHGMGSDHAKNDPEAYISGELMQAIGTWQSDSLCIIDKISLVEIVKKDRLKLTKFLIQFIKDNKE